MVMILFNLFGVVSTGFVNRLTRKTPSTANENLSKNPQKQCIANFCEILSGIIKWS